MFVGPLRTGASSATIVTSDRVEADLLLGFAESGRDEALVGLVDATARERELAAVVAVVGADDQHDAQLTVTVAVDRREHGRLLVSAGRRHPATCRSAGSPPGTDRDRRRRAQCGR